MIPEMCSSGSFFYLQIMPMKKSILLFIFCFALYTASVAQVSFEATEVIESVMDGDVDVAAKNKVSNDAFQVKNYRWERNVIEISDSWNSAVCDKTACYLPDVNSAEFMMGPGESGATMDVHVYPDGTEPASEGSAIIEVNIVDVNTDEIAGSAIYYFNTVPSSTIEVTKTAVRVYPNPTNSIFSLEGDEGVSQVAIFNVTGQRLKLFNAAVSSNSYDIRDLPRGTYFVQLLSANQQILTTKLLQKI
jgi:hypothetical protein